MTKIYFDLDGTIADLYNSHDWLNKLRAEESGVFDKLPTTCDLDHETVQELCEMGIEFGVISWLPMDATEEYEKICTKEKESWIKEHLPFVSEVNIIPFGTPKQKAIKKKRKRMYLIEDNANVLDSWITKSMRKGYLVNEEKNVNHALMAIREALGQ